MADITLSTTSAKAHPLPDRFQALYGQISGFDPFSKDSFLDVKVTEAKDGYVLLSLAIPESLTRGFVTFLDAMHNLMRCADQQAARAVRESRPVDVQEVELAQKRNDDFRITICSRFDDLIRQGVLPSDAVKTINAELKASSHPWASHEAVRSVLQSAGKFRRNPQGNRRRR